MGEFFLTEVSIGRGPTGTVFSILFYSSIREAYYGRNSRFAYVSFRAFEDSDWYAFGGFREVPYTVECDLVGYAAGKEEGGSYREIGERDKRCF